MTLGMCSSRHYTCSCLVGYMSSGCRYLLRASYDSEGGMKLYKTAHVPCPCTNYVAGHHGIVASVIWNVLVLHVYLSGYICNTCTVCISYPLLIGTLPILYTFYLEYSCTNSTNQITHCEVSKSDRKPCL